MLHVLKYFIRNGECGRQRRAVGNPPKGSASPGGCGRPGPPVLAPRKRGQQAGAKNGCENCDVNDVVSVFTLIRTDTTLDLSQKAEKV